MPLTPPQAAYLARLAGEMAKIIADLRSLRIGAQALDLPITFPPDAIFLRVISEAAALRHRTAPREPDPKA